MLLKEEINFWPDALEQRVIARWIQDKYKFPNCVGFIDGTLLSLRFGRDCTEKSTCLVNNTMLLLCWLCVMIKDRSSVVMLVGQVQFTTTECGRTED